MPIMRTSEPGRIPAATSKTLSAEVQAATLATAQLALTGLLVPVSPAQAMIVPTAAGALARNAQGDYSLNWTAGGAETVYAAARAPQWRNSAGKTATLKKVHFAYQLGVVAATSVNVLVDKCTYAHAVAPAVASYGTAVADAAYDANNNTNAKRVDHTVAAGEHLITVTLVAPTEMTGLDTIVNAELAVVLANTGTLKFRGIIFEYDSNINVP